MKRLQFHFYSVALVLFLILFSQCHTISQPDEYYCNLMSGEPTQTSVVLLARLQKTDTLKNNDIAGINGFIKFWITRDIKSKTLMESPFFVANETNDFIAKYQFTGLRPNQQYFYRISYGRDTSNNTTSPWNTFNTLNPPGSEKTICFVIGNGIDFNAFRDGDPTNNIQRAGISALKKGFPVFHTINSAKPDFLIANGEIGSVYNSRDSLPFKKNDLVTQWHSLFSMSDFNTMLSQTPFYWMLQSDEDMSEVTAQHLPIAMNNELPGSYCRTYRLNRDVQIWMLGKNDYYKDNAENTSVLWLKKTLKESDAPFKLLIGPSALFAEKDPNPDETNIAIGELKTRKDSLFIWLKNNGFRNNGLYFINCTKQQQFHSLDFTGFEEFSCGTFLPANFRKENFSPDSLSANLAEKIVFPYIQNEASAGFLIINSDRDEYNSPVLLFRFFDDQKKLLYAVKKF